MRAAWKSLVANLTAAVVLSAPWRTVRVKIENEAAACKPGCWAGSLSSSLGRRKLPCVASAPLRTAWLGRDEYSLSLLMRAERKGTWMDLQSAKWPVVQQIKYSPGSALLCQSQLSLQDWRPGLGLRLAGGRSKGIPKASACSAWSQRRGTCLFRSASDSGCSYPRKAVGTRGKPTALVTLDLVASFGLSAVLECITNSSKGTDLSDQSALAGRASQLPGGRSYVSASLGWVWGSDKQWMTLALHPPRLRPELLHANVLLCFQVTNYDSATGLPLIQLWNLTGDEVGIFTYLFFQHC